MASLNMKIKRSSTPDLICEKIEELITQGTWKVDEKIPSEAELAETFGVNRFTIRMALQKLNTLGVLETLVGDGTYVRSFDFERLVESVSHLYMTPELLNDVSEFRAAIETECIRLAMKRYTEEELAELEICCQTFENSISAYVAAKHDSIQRQRLFEQFNDDDIALHTQLCKMSHNELLIHAYSTAKAVIRQQMLTLGHKRVQSLEPGDEIISVQSHWNIYHAMRRRDFRTCKRILTEMINNDAEKI